MARALTLQSHFSKNEMDGEHAAEGASPPDGVGAPDPLTHSSCEYNHNFIDLCVISHLQALGSETIREIVHPSPPRVGNPHFYPIHSRPGTLDLFQNLVEEDLIALKHNTEITSKGKFINITNSEKRALKDMKDNSDLLIRARSSGRPERGFI